MSTPSCSSRFRQAAAGLAALIAGGFAATPVPAQVAPVSPTLTSATRFWFYRDFFPEDTGDMPAIAMNGTAIGYGLAGTNFYRDMPAGRYLLTVESVGQDWNQSQDLAAAPGQVVYVKIASLPSWEQSSRGGYRRGTYYVMIVAPQLAALEMPQTRYTSGN
jgi:hypothetical protein